MCVLLCAAACGFAAMPRWEQPAGGTFEEVNPGVFEVKDRPLVFSGFSGDSVRLKFKARVPGDDGTGQFWFSTNYKEEFQRYAMAVRSGELSDIFLTRYRQSDFPKSITDVHYGYDLGFRADLSEWTDVVCEVRGSRITVWVNGAKFPQADFRDWAPLPGGKIALGGGWEPAQFKDIQVEPLDPDEPFDVYGPRTRKFTFGKTAQEMNNGYVISSGEAYDKRKGFGWENDLSRNARDRGPVRDPLLKGVVFAQVGDGEQVFRCDVPPGEYVVTAGGGDVSSYGQMRIDVNGVRLIDAVLTPNEFVDQTVRVRCAGNEGIQVRLKAIDERPNGVINPINYLIVEPLSEALVRIPDLESTRRKDRQAYQPLEFTASDFNAGKSVSLDGEWLFMPVQNTDETAALSRSASDSNWHVISVPSYWSPNATWIYTGQRRAGPSFRTRELRRVNAQTFDWRNTKAAWYRQWITLPKPGEEGNRYRMTFDASASITRVYVNGKLAGSHTGQFAPFEVDITDGLDYGKPNLISVQVIGEPELDLANHGQVLGTMVTMIVTPEHVGSLPRGIIYSTIRDMRNRPTNERPSGIWQSVSLRQVAPARLTDWFFHPDKNGASVEISVTAPSGQKWSGEVTLSVAGEELRETLAIPAGEIKTVVLPVRPENVKRWEPGSPNLYPIEIGLVENGKTIDQISDQVGFRTVAVTETQFLLNGRPYFLAGGNLVTHGLTPNSQECARQTLEMMVQNNLRMVRSHASPMSETWLDEADELGLAISLEGSWPWVLTMNTEIPSDELWDAFVRETLDLVRHYRNHPSVFIWTLSNENHMCWDTDEVRRLKKWRMWEALLKQVRELDPTRPICAYSGYERMDTRHPVPDAGTSKDQYYELFIKKNGIDDGDFSDEHRYTGIYAPTILNYLYEELPRSYGQGIPLISQEASTGYPNNDFGHMERTYINTFVPQAWVGDDAYDHRNPMPFLVHSGTAAKEWMEKVRRDRKAAGWLLFNSGNWLKRPYVPGRIEAWPAMKLAGESMQPVLISMKQRDRHVFAGSAFRAELHVINDSADGTDLTGLTGSYTLRDEAGAPVVFGKLDFPDTPYYTNRSVPFEFTVPPGLRFGEYSLTFALMKDAEKLSENSYALKIATPAWAEEPVRNAAPVYIFEADQPVRDVLKTMRVPVAASESDAGVGIWDGKELPPKESDEMKALLGFVEKGGTLIVSRTRNAHTVFDERIGPHREKQEWLFPEYVSVRDRSHPLLDGFGPHDLKWWNGNGGRPEVCQYVYTVADEGSDEVPVQYIEPHLSSGWVERFRTPFVEFLYGRGRVMVSEFNVQVSDTDPLARRLFANILRVAGTPVK